MKEENYIVVKNHYTEPIFSAPRVNGYSVYIGKIEIGVIYNRFFPGRKFLCEYNNHSNKIEEFFVVSEEKNVWWTPPEDVVNKAINRFRKKLYKEYEYIMERIQPTWEYNFEEEEKEDDDDD